MARYYVPSKYWKTKPRREVLKENICLDRENGEYINRITGEVISRENAFEPENELEIKQ